MSGMARWTRVGNLWAVAAPFVCREALREFPGMRWDQSVRGWTCSSDLVDPVTQMLVSGGVDVAFPPLIPPPTEDLPCSSGLHLRAYQTSAVAFIRRVAAGGGALLALPMGAGKSLCAIRVAEERGGPTLIICPGMVKGVWAGVRGELRKWHPSADVRICSTRTVDPGVLFGLGRNSFVVANFEILDDHKTGRLLPNGKPERASSPWVDALGRVPFTTVIVDEAHAIKNRGGARTSAIKTLSAKIGHGKHLRIAQTGTPIWNRPADIWSLLDWIHPGGRWGSFWSFARRFADAGNHTGYGWEAKGVTNAEELAHRLQWVMFRRSKSEILDWLPPKTRQVVVVSAEASAGRIASVESEMASGGKVPRSELLAAIHREGGTKAQSVVGLIAGCSERVVAFTSLRDTADGLGKALRKSGVKAWVIHGEHPQSVRDAAIEEFSLVRTPAALVATYGVAGVGIDLSCASVAVMVDLDYVPSAMLQAEDRLHRPGQQSAVTVYYVCVGDSVDEDVARMVVEKLDQMTAVLGGDSESDGLRAAVANVVGQDDDGQRLIDLMLQRLSERASGGWVRQESLL